VVFLGGCDWLCCILAGSLIWKPDNQSQLVINVVCAFAAIWVGLVATEDAEPEKIIDWADELRPQGTSTTIGAAIQFIINKERGGPLAGVVVISDGQSNSGLPLPAAVAAAENAKVAVFPVGVGSTEVLKNIEIADIQAPPRVLPQDDFKLAVILKSFGFKNRQVRVTLTSTADDQSLPEGEPPEETRRITVTVGI